MSYSTINRRKIQHKVNRLFHALNSNLANDELWRGRFFVRQYAAPRFEISGDRTLAQLYIQYRIYDKKTRKYQEVFTESFELTWGGAYRFWLSVNNFIVETIKVWNEEPRPSIQTAEDWTKIEIPLDQYVSCGWPIALPH